MKKGPLELEPLTARNGPPELRGTRWYHQIYQAMGLNFNHVAVFLTFKRPCSGLILARCWLP